MTDEWMARMLGVQESYTDPETTYRAAKARGMTHVTLTDRDTIHGALRLSGYPDFLMGEEVTAFFPSEALHVDVLVWGLGPSQHEQIQRHRFNIFRLVDYLNEEQLAFGLAHPASFQIGGLRAEHFEQLLVLFPLWEVRDGHSDAADNALVERLLESGADRLPDLAAKHGLPAPVQPPRGFGGSDDRSGLDVGTTFTEVLVNANDLVTALRTRDLLAGGEDATTPKVAHTGASLFAGSANAGGRVANWTFQHAQRSLMLRELLSSATGRRLVGRALSVAAVGSRPFRSTTWQSAALREAATELSRSGPDWSHARHERLAATAEAAWQRVLTDNLQRIQDRAGRSRPGDEVREILQAQILVAPYLSAAAYRARQRQHAQRVARVLADGELLPRQPSSQSPRVAMFTDTYEEVNGVATVLQELRRHAEQRGWPFTLVDCGPERLSGPCLETFVPVHTLAWQVYAEFPMHIGPILELLRWCEDEQVEVIHAATSGPVGLLAALIAKALHLPLVATYHTDMPRLAYFLTRDHSAEELMWTFVRWFYGQCRLIFCPSHLIQEDLADHGVRGPFAPFDQAVDGDVFSPAHRSEELHREMGGGEKVVLWVGRVSAEKGLDLLAAAYSSLRSRRDDVRLVVVGDGPYRETLQKRMTQVTFLGYKSGPELSAIYASADLFVFPGLADTFGQVVLEAAASGLPSVVSAGVAVDEIIERGKTALTVAPGDAEGFAAAVATLLDDDVRRRQMGEAARRRALTRSWAVTFDGVWDAYRDLTP
jgi:glycosyltransferase involved in cell wall biosynthesis